MERPQQSAPLSMAWIPSATFRLGSNKHYLEEAPVDRVTVSGFWIDRTPVANRQFKEFVRVTGQKTFAEIPPDPKSYPAALPHMFYAGSLVFTPRHPVDLKNQADAPKACCVRGNLRGAVEGSYDPCLPAATFPAKSSRAVRICARRITAAANARPPAMRKTWTPPQAIWDFDAWFERGAELPSNSGKRRN